MANNTQRFLALSDPTRRAIFERLSKRPKAVGELAKGLPITRPAVSQHLKVLREARLVTCEQRGTRRFYRIDPSGVAAMRSYLDRFWDHALDAFKSAAEENEEDT
ncbi:MAG: metalloregulator ArsR/SmtB family transcription factor [Myxococcaceae bacterium]|nr:metalloregulator ArsR/SmtB family transcription factor [Myxococcaceae bacterium]